MPNTEDKKVITRFPPSPTGLFHLGNTRTALYNYFFAKQKGGDFIVRVEDTDKARSKKEYEENMLESLEWLGIKRDGELWHQSERTKIYQQYLKKLIDDSVAYISQESEGENKEVIRFKNPNTEITFSDLIRGDITFDTTELGDFVIAKNIHEPLYHLAVVIDDHEAGVTHIIRGEDHVSNTPRQILIQNAIGAHRPIYAHLPLILAKDRSKLSKRKHGEAVSLEYYRKKGYLPEALVNYLALIGWNPGTDQEIFSLQELVDNFDLAKVQKGGAIFDEEKLKWVNKEHMKKLPEEVILKEIEVQITATSRFTEKGWQVDENTLKRGYKSIFERITVWQEVVEMAENGDLDYFFETPEFDAHKLLWKPARTATTGADGGEKDLSVVSRHIEKVISIFEKIAENNWNTDDIKNAIWDYAEKEGRGNVLWPIRYALSGKDKSPDPFTLAFILGKDETLLRLNEARKKL